MDNEPRRNDIKKRYRQLRAAVGEQGLSQQAVEQAARAIYPEFGKGRFWRIENGLDYPTPSERSALGQVLNVAADELPSSIALQAAS